MSNLLVHEIHVSEIREFKKCRFAHNLKFVHQYYPKGASAKPLEFGTAFHAANEIFYNPDTMQYPPDVRKELAILKFLEINTAQRDNIINITPEQFADYDERVVLGVGMLNYYYSELAPTLDVNFEPAFVEMKFSVPVVHPTTGEAIYCKCDKCWSKVDKTDFDEDELKTDEEQWNYWEGLPVHLEGKIDLVLRDKKTGKFWLLDWKTAARFAENHEWLEMDDQVIFYLLAMYLLNIDVAGFIYHEQSKSFPQPPKKNATKRQGRLFSVDKMQDTNYEIYLDTIINEDSEGYYAGNYADFLMYLENTPKQFYNRETIRKNAGQLELAHADLYAVAREIVNPDKILYPSPSKYNCGYCEFQQVCIGRFTLSDYQSTLESQFEKKAPYYER